MVSASGGGAARRTVIVVADDRVAGAALAEQLRAHGLTVLGEASTTREARALLARSPDLAIIDRRLLDEPTVELIREASRRPVLVIVLSEAEDDATVFRAIEAGAIGYLTKTDPHACVVDAIECALAGGSPMSPRIVRRLLARLAGAASTHSEPLTPREAEIAELFGRGATYEDVGAALAISVNTVRHHVRTMYEKLHVASKAELVAKMLARPGRRSA